jgi:hypothetical protein
MRITACAFGLCLCFCAAFATSEECSFQRPACLIFDGIIGVGAYSDDAFNIGDAGYTAGADLSLHFNYGDLGEFAGMQGLTLGVATLGTVGNEWKPHDVFLTAGYRIGWNGRGTGWYYVSSGRSELTEWGQNYLEIGALNDRVYGYFPDSGRLGYRYSGWGAFLGGGNYALSGGNAFTRHAGSTWNIRAAVWKQPAGLYFPASSHHYSIEDSGWRLGIWIDIGFCFI